MSNLNETLDSILSRYYHKSTSPGEKEASLNVFHRKCKSNNINADNYKQNYERRMMDDQLGRKSYNTRNNYSSEGFYGFDDIFTKEWNDIFRRAREAGRSNKRNNQSRSGSNTYSDSSYTGPGPGSFDYEKTQSGSRVYGSFNDCIYEVSRGNIRIQAMCKVGDRQAIENYVFYCGDNPNKVLETLKKYDMFKFTSNGNRYSGYLNINKLWGLDLNLKEHSIY